MLKFAPPYDWLIDHTIEPTQLPDDARFGNQAAHAWSDAERNALAHAWASQRPLLVRGEAGCGKSQLARAAAAVLGVPLEVEVIHPRFEASDLKYREDAVRRLAKAQIVGALRPENLSANELLAWLNAQLNPEDFVDRGAIWRAIEKPAPEHLRKPRPSVWPRAVLLIDEVDKADADVPNALLDVLGNRSFTVPYRKQPVTCQEHFPLVIITTNEDRELPAAFVRRCAVLNLNPRGGKDEREKFIAWLLERARAHAALKPLAAGCKGMPAEAVFRRAAEQTFADRVAAADQGLPTVGLAEYLDLLYGLLRLSAGDPAHAATLLNELSAFALVKHSEQDQSREAIQTSY